MSTPYDIAIVGAGPAGMGAAIEARRSGLRVVVLDEAAAPGGQIYRAVENAADSRGAVLGEDYLKGLDLAKRFRSCGAEYRPDATVWQIEPEIESYRVYSTTGGKSTTVSATSLILATGALERPVPLPGWTLPGVTTAGAMQILLKSAGGVADDLVLVGSGPLLYLIASQMIDAGAPPLALVETNDRSRMWSTAQHLPGALRARRQLNKGLDLIRRIKAAKVPIYPTCKKVVIEGDTRAEAVRFESGGKAHRIETGSVALHEGVIPNTQITRLLLCDHDWHPSQSAFVPVLDEFGQSSLRGVFVAGDGGGIAGAASAELAGRLAAMRIAELAGHSPGGKEKEKLLSDLRADAAIRPLLEKLYAPGSDSLQPADDTVICRCEEITAGDVRRETGNSLPGANQVKAFMRPGMGPCQGRVCGLVVSRIVAETLGRDETEMDYFRIRPPLKPLPLAELAAFVPEDEA